MIEPSFDWAIAFDTLGWLVAIVVAIVFSLFSLGCNFGFPWGVKFEPLPPIESARAAKRPRFKSKRATRRTS